jgi:RNase H-fold protein (predicted Holliday junction resolvase)
MGRRPVDFREVIQEYEILAVVLGCPAHDKTLTTIEYISRLARSISAEFAVEVIVLHEGEIVEHFQPSVGKLVVDE